MNKKSLLLIFSMVAVVSCGLMGEEKKTQRTPAEHNEIMALLYYHFKSGNPDHGAFGSCVKTGSDNCDLVINHLKNARDHQKQQTKIKSLTDEMSHLSSEQKKRPLKNRLDKAKKECPMCDRSYWATLSAPIQDSLIDAAAEIAEGENRTMSSSINKLTEALSQ